MRVATIRLRSWAFLLTFGVGAWLSGGCAGGASGAARPALVEEPVTVDRWLIDNTTSIHGVVPELIGAPVVTSTPEGNALCFGGSDGIVLAANPLQGLGAFTLEVLLRIDGVTAAELSQPRYLHIETTDASRATMEARVTETTWYLDTFLLSGSERKTLADSSKVHPVGAWTWTALTYQSPQMRHYVDGIEDANGTVTVPPFGPGKLSLGVRQNLVYWFKGCIRELRITNAALAPAQLQKR